ncbi:MAG: hypothetical protein G01um101420_945 [Parcubacteria group bacterium Gr01-1014_20]|nr:MAG: hypothetical protein G01um101420_945 [Parcubacteria group bacterium Gr01-1014_20]
MDSTKSKFYFWVLLDVLVAALIVNVVFFVMPAVNHFGESLYPVRNLNVSAEGKTTVKPDIAQFSFSVITEGADLEKITSDNNKRIAEVVKYIKGEGISADDIKTTQYNLQPKYQYIESQKKSYISGYELTQSVFVKVRELDKNLGKISTILGSLPEMGINQISGVSFTVDDPEEFMVKAREEAFRKAHEKATAIAKANGISLGRVLNASEFQNGPIYYGAYDKAGFGGAPAMSLSVPAPLEPGTQEIVVNVNVTYALR